MELDLRDKRVELEIGVDKERRWKDSAGQADQVHGWEERQWRQLDAMQFENTIRTILF